MKARRGLAVVETHPVQYHAPVYRRIEQNLGIPVTAIYGSDSSVAGALDREFGTAFAWDTDLLSGYSPVFLARGGAAAPVGGLGRALQAADPAAVLIVGYSSSIYRRAFASAFRGRIPVLFRAETTDHAHERSAAKRWVRGTLLRSLYARCSALLYIGQRSRDHFTRLGCAQEKLFFSPYCVDTAPFQAGESARRELRSAARRELEIADRRIVLLFSGKLSHRKGPDLLVSAAKQLPRELRDRIVLVFLGSGQMQHELEFLANSTPAIETRFAGFRNQTQLSRFYHAADLLVLPSRHSETWGLVVNEALHHGVPCVVSEAVGCAPDLAVPGATGEICETDCASGLASALARAMALTANSEIRRRCRERVAAYSVEKAAEGIAEAYWTAALEGSSRVGVAGAIG